MGARNLSDDLFRVGHETLVTNAGREVESLDGPWRLTLDLFDEGLHQNWPALDESDPAQWDKPRDYEIAGGTPVQVPSCWNTIRPEWRYFEGTGWYMRHFDWHPESDGERVVLRIGAAAYETRVFLNGRFLGWHRGGSTPICVELTSALLRGRNRLQIAVDNRRRADRIPAERFDWFNYGGLYREVGLLRLPPVFIRSAQAAVVPDRSLFTIRADVVLSDPLDGVATFQVPELSIAIDIPLHGGVGTGVVAATPTLWSPATPKLYDVQFRFGDDTVRDRVGFREITASGQQLFLNGAPFRLRGICVHEDDPALGKCSTDEQVRRLFAHAAELNCNFLRLAHYPHHERVARLADELGFLLWEEVPVYWDIDFASADAYRDAENQLLELVHRDGNRASVIFWSLGNETPDKDDRNRFMTGLAQAVRRADNTRLLAAACSVQNGRFEDRLSDVLDVVGFNEYFGWYDPDLAGLDRALAESKPRKPVLISETGADALAGLRDARGILSSEERQAEVYRQQFKRLGDASSICGVSPWLLYDFRSERRQSSVQRGFNRKGLVAEDKTTKKLAFSVLAETYRQLAAKHEGRPPGR